MNALFVSEKGKKCGVGDYGERLFDCLKLSKKINFKESNTINIDNIDVVLYNYHNATLPHITDSYLNDKRHIKHIVLFHESSILFTPDKVIDVCNVPRPIIYNNNHNFKANGKITIGSFGFGFPNKNFPKIAQLVKEQFDVAIIKLNIPFATYGDYDGSLAKNEIEKIKQILLGTNIELEVNHDYLNKNEVVEFLSKNDINLFLFDEMNNRGLSSSLDYALESNRPIGLSKSYMFRHFKNVSSSIFVDELSINDIIVKGIEPLKPIRNYHNCNNLLNVIEKELL